MATMKLMGAAMLVVVLLTGPALAEPQGEQARVTARVSALLAGFEHVPTEADWKAAGPEELVATALLQVATDAGARASSRARALSAMRYVPTEPVKAHLTALVKDSGADALLRSKAALTLGALGRDAALPVLGTLLGSGDPYLREAGVRAVAEARSEAALALLREHAAREKDPVVRATAEQLRADLEHR
jgi:hypothetical protein